MPSPIEVLHEYVRSRYRESLSAILETAKAQELKADSGPAWVWQDEQLKSVSDKSSARGAVVVDAQIGLCFYSQVFSPTSDIRAQISRALAVRSELVPRRQARQEDIDEYGEWSVCVLWLVEAKDFRQWVSQVAEQRQETAHFEEISVDALVSTGDWLQACQEHGLPRLLLNTRAAIHRRTLNESALWANADLLVGSRLRNLLSSVSDSLKGVAQEVNREITNLESVKAKTVTSRNTTLQPKPLFRIGIENFRNIDRLSLDLRTESDPTATNIIQGPNGTGKSSIAEALSIAVGKTSPRYLDFLSDPNDGGQNKGKKYLEKYVSQLRGDKSAPRISLNGADFSRVELCEPELAKENCQQLSGTILSQSWSENLLRMRANDLGAQIAANYSTIASGLIDFVESSAESAETERAIFNKEWGLRANVSKDETARVRIATRTLARCMPSSDPFYDWLQTGARLRWSLQEEAQAVLSAWTDWRAKAGVRENGVAKCSSEEEIRHVLNAELGDYEKLIVKTSELFSATRSVSASVFSRVPDIEQKLRRWSEWLRQDSKAATPVSELVELRDRQARLQRELIDLGNLGSTERQRIEHLSEVKQFIELHWSTSHPDTCPICESYVGDRSGIVETLKSTRANAEAAVTRLRREYAEKKKSLDLVANTLSARGDATPPLQADDVVLVEQTTQDVLGTTFTLDMLSDGAVHSDVQRVMEYLRGSIPSVSAPRSSDAMQKTATESAQAIWSLFQRFAEVSEAPDAWKAMRKLVSSSLSATMSEHLPKTVQALWWELAKNVMPAPWQYPGAVRFDIEQGRSQTEARLVVEAPTAGTLAAYILNGAELHNLGLAWFLTRYLTYGRFLFSFLILDDPAYQMDQPTFRDFCRLLERLVRLHKRARIPLTLVLFLHQDDRALDAARATDATLHLLRWHRGTASLTKKIRMWIAPTGPKRPYRMIQA